MSQLIIQIVGGILCCALLVLIIVCFISKKIKKTNRKKVISHGKRIKATYLRTVEGLLITHRARGIVVGTTQYYEIEFQYKNENGQIVYATSSGRYSLEEAKCFEFAKTFEICVFKNEVEIPKVPAMNSIYKKLKK